MNWTTVCQLDDILPGTGVCAKAGSQQVALFRPLAEAQVFALSNIDPFGQASVLSRGLVGEKDGLFYVASPLLKQRFCLSTGQCLDDKGVVLETFPVRIQKGAVQLKF